MGSSAQRLKLSTGISEIGRLVQPNFIAHQNQILTHPSRAVAPTIS